MKQKIETKFFVFEINPSEFVALNCIIKREHLPSALSVLANSFDILHSANRDFL